MKTILVVYVISSGILIVDPTAPEFNDAGKCAHYAMFQSGLYKQTFFCAPKSFLNGNLK